MHQALAEAADFSGVLDQRETGAQRCGTADGDIRRCGHRKARGGKSQYEVIGLLAHREMLALADDVPDVAPHKEIAGHRAGKARNVVGIAGDEAGGKAFCKLRAGIVFRHRIAHPLRQFVAERDVIAPRELSKAAGEVGIARGERSLDIVVDKARIISQSRIDLQAGKLGRVVLRRQHRPGVAGIRP